MTQHEEDILNEQVAAQQRVITEVEAEGALALMPVVALDDRIRLRAGEELPAGHRPLRLAEIQAALKQASLCGACGKTRVVLNLAGYRRPFQAERITAETHCSCPPRVEGGGARIAAGPAWELVSVECEYCDHGEIIDLVDSYIEKTVCGMCNGVGRVRKPGLQQERAS
jgi:hypothetical protein